MYSLWNGFSRKDHTRIAYVHPSLQTVNRVIKMNILGGQRSFGFMTLQELPNHKPAPAPAHPLTTQDDVDPHRQFRISCSWSHKIWTNLNGKDDMNDIPSIGLSLILLRICVTWLRIWKSLKYRKGSPSFWSNVQPLKGPPHWPSEALIIQRRFWIRITEIINCDYRVSIFRTKLACSRVDFASLILYVYLVFIFSLGCLWKSKSS